MTARMPLRAWLQNYLELWLVSFVAQRNEKTHHRIPDRKLIDEKLKKTNQQGSASKAPAFDAAAYSFFDFAGGSSASAGGGGLDDVGGLEVRFSFFLSFFLRSLDSSSSLSQPLSLSVSSLSVPQQQPNSRTASTPRQRRRAPLPRRSRPRKMAWTL